MWWRPDVCEARGNEAADSGSGRGAGSCAGTTTCATTPTWRIVCISIIGLGRILKFGDGFGSGAAVGPAAASFSAGGGEDSTTSTSGNRDGYCDGNSYASAQPRGILAGVECTVRAYKLEKRCSGPIFVSLMRRCPCELPFALGHTARRGRNERQQVHDASGYVPTDNRGSEPTPPASLFHVNSARLTELRDPTGPHHVPSRRDQIDRPRPSTPTHANERPGAKTSSCPPAAVMATGACHALGGSFSRQGHDTCRTAEHHICNTSPMGTYLPRRRSAHVGPISLSRQRLCHHHHHQQQKQRRQQRPLRCLGSCP
jgi:hypothetical protein